MVWHSFADEQDLFPCYLYKPCLKDSEDNFIPYDPDKDLENPRRCIFAPATNSDGKSVQSKDELSYFSNMSEAMARWGDGTASVMNENAADLTGEYGQTQNFPLSRSPAIREEQSTL